MEQQQYMMESMSNGLQERMLDSDILRESAPSNNLLDNLDELQLHQDVEFKSCPFHCL